ncbi:MAG: hypothetical protein EPN82_09770 [Bacteroidetes bacterium]|nr:MAG: hypothetical protein EPN82_09770 [Bacteroidota bacterium]
MENHNFQNSSLTPKNVFEVLEKNNIKQRFGDVIFDLCLWLITWISNESLKWKFESVPISSLFLRKICSHNDKQVIKILIDAGIIVKTMEANYFVKESNEYCINKKFTASKTNSLMPRFYRSSTLQRRIARNYRQDLLQNKLNKKLESNFLYKMLTEKTSFNSDASMEYISNTYIESSQEYKIRYETINYLREGFIWGHYARHCNRFYSTFTQLPSDLRPFVVIDKEQTDKVYFDICNSQVQMFIFDILSKNKDLLETKDSARFFELVSNNDKDFYSEMIQIIDVDETRDTIKPLFSHLLYNINSRFIGLVNDSKLKDFYVKFKLHFPTVWQYLQKIKSNKTACSKFSVLLMNLESDFILNKVAKKLYKENIALVTIHDEFMVNREHEFRAEEIFVEESLKYFGNVLKYKKSII